VTLRLGVIHAMGDHTTLPSRGLWLRRIGKSGEASELPLGFKTRKAQNEKMFSGLPPKAELPLDLRTTPAASSTPAKAAYSRRGPASIGAT